MAMTKRNFSQEYDEFTEAMETVCMYCVRPADLEGTGEPCNSCYVRETYDWYRKRKDLRFTEKTYHVEVSRSLMRSIASDYGLLLTDDQCDRLAGYLDEDAFDHGSLEHYLDFDMIPGELYECRK